ncbi:MAG: glycosyl transferase family 1 [Salinicola sp.]|uniref:glycosyltransferase family 4 protein n=1 Tax=uncultured Salinicola sp. TaxID=1193542 RepID=UPI000C8AA9BE|nr:glycosyltransferase family 4 protein [uncultured Salinicola sp.]MAM58846.1 glycosyl transferase family 1 [Salinicola sp.]|tara:strand:- start:343 stop:1518 length:1176 start_codon:yes stop_codon:yes gene_type:complete
MIDNIVIFSRSLPMHGLGGMEVAAWDLAVGLTRLGYRVVILTTSIPGEPEIIERDGVLIEALPVASGRYSREWWKSSRSRFKDRYMTSASCVVSVSSAALGILSLRNRIPDVPFLFQAHGTSWGEIVSKWRSLKPKSIATSIKNFLWLPRDVLAYRQFDYVVAVGANVQKDLLKLCDYKLLKPEKIRLISNGIDTELFSPSLESRRCVRQGLGVDDESLIILSANRLHSQKGTHHGLEVFYRVRKHRPDSLYIIAGDGVESKNLKKQVMRLGLEKSVIFLGRVERQELSRYLSAADQFLFLTERTEGLPLTILESLACGVPVFVSSHVTLFDSPFVNFVDFKDYEEITSRLINAANVTRERRLAVLPREYSLENAVRSYESLIREKASGQV